MLAKGPVPTVYSEIITNRWIALPVAKVDDQNVILTPGMVAKIENKSTGKITNAFFAYSEESGFMWIDPNMVSIKYGDANVLAVLFQKIFTDKYLTKIEDNGEDGTNTTSVEIDYKPDYGI